MAKFHPFYQNKDGTLNWKILFVVPLIVFTIWISYLAYNYFSQGLDSENWQKTDAKINTLDLRERENTGGTMSRKIFISYDYVFDGKNYSGDRVAFGYLADRLDQHSNLFKIIKEASPAKVYVNPEKPEQSTLISGTSNGTVVIVIIALYSLASCIRFFLFLVGIEINNNQHLVFFFGAIMLSAVIFLKYFNTLDISSLIPG